jgi:hypothetical protein
MEGGHGREAKTTTPSIEGVGNQDCVARVNLGEALINVVIKNKPKMLTPGERR